MSETSRRIFVGFRSFLVGALIVRLWDETGWPLALVAVLAFVAHLCVEADTHVKAERP